MKELREKYATELKEHPRFGRAMVELATIKDHLEKAGHDFGGHKAAAIKSIDATMAELKEAIKFDAKREAKEGKPEGGPGGPGGPGGGPGGKPGDGPAPKPAGEPKK